MSRLVRVSPNAAAAARDVAAFILRELRAAIRERGHATFVAAGGSTPLEVYRLLARSRDRFPWPALDVFFGDDRYVPAESPDRNERAVREAWLDRVPLPADRIHAMPAAPAERDASSPSLDDEATRHERTLRDALAARGATAQVKLIDAGDGVQGEALRILAGLAKGVAQPRDQTAPGGIRRGIVVVEAAAEIERSIGHETLPAWHGEVGKATATSLPVPARQPH